MNTNHDNMPNEYIKRPVRMPEEKHDKILIDERRKREAIK
jgi:hypothetical protein